MNGPEILRDISIELSDLVTGVRPPEIRPLVISPWVAMSLLQKAVRRGEENLALRAAATLLTISPERLWRRLGCIAFEDIGLADLQAVGLVTVGLAGKRFRATLGGEWKVASYLVSRMAKSRKCRATDDLLLAAEQHPTYAAARRELAHLEISRLLSISTGSAPLPEQALAVWFGIGTVLRPSNRLAERRGEPRAVFDHLCEAGIPHTVVEVAREGFRKVGEVLCPFVPLLYPQRQLETVAISDDPISSDTMIGDVPAWSLDLYTREGRRAFETFLSGETMTARLVRANITPAKRIHVLGTAVFRAEGGLCRQRMHWPTGDELRRKVDVECFGSAVPDASALLDTVRGDLAELNRVRRDVL